MATLKRTGRADLSLGPVHYHESGEGRPLVFVHGLMMTADLWAEVVPALASHFRCLAPDWPLGAHPEPMRPDAHLTPDTVADLILEFLEALDLQDVTLVGNDTGGALCTHLAGLTPPRVQRLVLTPCDAYDIFPPGPYKWLLWAPRIPGAMTLAAYATRLDWVRRSPIAFGWLSKRRLDDDLLDSFLLSSGSRAIRNDAGKFLRAISSDFTGKAAANAHKFKGEVLIAWGTEDKVFPRAHAERLAKAFRNATLEWVEEARTFVMIDQPDQFVELMTRSLS
jgi:pimeloyl-ACP methyl ester carboxylesterase